MDSTVSPFAVHVLTLFTPWTDPPRLAAVRDGRPCPPRVILEGFQLQVSRRLEVNLKPKGAVCVSTKEKPRFTSPKGTHESLWLSWCGLLQAPLCLRCIPVEGRPSDETGFGEASTCGG